MINVRKLSIDQLGEVSEEAQTYLIDMEYRAGINSRPSKIVFAGLNEKPPIWIPMELHPLEFEDATVTWQGETGVLYALSPLGTPLRWSVDNAQWLAV